MVLSSLKTQDKTSNNHLSKVRDDADEIGTQTEFIVIRNYVTQMDPVIKIIFIQKHTMQTFAGETQVFRNSALLQRCNNSD